MKALVYTGVETLEYREVPQPAPGAGEELIRVMASGICGSDMHAYMGHDDRRPAPLILGHEAAGVVVGGPDDGRRVTINPLVTCNDCPACNSGRTNLCAKRQIISMPPREGAFANFVTMPRSNLITVPDTTSLSHAALTEPMACGWHGARLAHIALNLPMGEMCCLVIGGGAIGVGAALSLAALGATNITVIEPNDIRRECLQNVSGFITCDPTDGIVPQQGSVDIVIDAVGFAATRKTACAYVRPGGVIVHIGLGEATGGLDIRRMTLQEIQFIGTYTYTAADFIATADAIFAGQLGALNWFENRPLADGQEAFRDIRSNRVAAPKIILIPEHTEP
jgi:L-gulonate 5-dehydrogenase